MTNRRTHFYAVDGPDGKPLFVCLYGSTNSNAKRPRRSWWSRFRLFLWRYARILDVIVVLCVIP